MTTRDRLKGAIGKDFEVERLGEQKIASSSDSVYFVDDDFVLLDPSGKNSICKAEMAGPHSKLFFEASKVRVAINSCGGLCPGINSVLRSIVLTLHFRYGVRQIIGFKYGFEGFNEETSEKIELTPDFVKDLHHVGGSVLGMSRGPQDVKKMVDFLVKEGINMVFTIGGDGTFKGAHEMALEVKRRNLSISIIGVPKTIDNDLMWTERSFGFDTAVEEAKRALNAAHNEARSAKNGVGIVKLMGRDSGFIALHASIASSDVNLLLLPEVQFKKEVVFDWILKRLKERNHILIAIAEGAGQDILQAGPPKFDLSGNKLLADVGIWLRDELNLFLKQQKLEFTIKYIDPSYMIRAQPANTSDSIFCAEVGQMVVHLAMSGRTDCTVGLVNGNFIALPLQATTKERKKVDPTSLLYQTMLDCSGMPVKLT